jgi:NAD(P) transhydrogenase subunit beta
VLTMIPQFTICANDLMAVFLLMSGLAMLFAIVASLGCIISINMGGTSAVFDAVLTVLLFVLGKLSMASMLQMVALYNVIGGGASSAVAAVEMSGDKAEGTGFLVVALIGALIGAVSLSGSLIAWTKLNGILEKPMRVIGQHALSVVVIMTALAVGCYIVFAAQGGTDRLFATPGLIYWPLGCALLFGALITLPIAGAQMPVVISVYNAFTGLAVGLEGFVLGSPTLVIAGIVIGCARALLTLLMVRGWNEEAAHTDRISESAVVFQSAVEHRGLRQRDTIRTAL